MKIYQLKAPFKEKPLRRASPDACLHCTVLVSQVLVLPPFKHTSFSTEGTADELYRLQTEPPGSMAHINMDLSEQFGGTVFCHHSLRMATALQAKQTTFCLTASQRTGSQRACASQAPGDHGSKCSARNCTSCSPLLWLGRWEPTVTTRVALTTAQPHYALAPSPSDHTFCAKSGTQMGSVG